MTPAIGKFKELRIEINAECNRNCSFCPRGVDDSRWFIDEETGRKRKVKNLMPIDTIKSLLNQNMTQGFRANVGFDFYNEPTLDDRLFSILDYAKKIGTPRLHIVTNGDKMKKDPLYTKALFDKVDYMNISLYDYKDMKGLSSLIKWWQNYLSNLNVPSHKYCASGASVFNEGGFYIYNGFSNRAGQIPRIKGKRKFMAHADKDKDLPLKASCKKIHSKMNIRFDGEVSICCEDALVQYSLGNINDMTISEIWYGKKMVAVTNILNRGERGKIKPCSKCTKGVCPVKIK